jgi:hypothetical protein
MEALKRVADVETAYGEGFVVDINGVKSGHTEGESADWFFYVNGILANTGALGYSLRGGDIEQWAFHDWSFHAFIPAIIGHFPEPFRHGYRGNICPTIVVYDEDMGETARALANRLGGLGVKDVFVQNVKGLSQESKKQSNLILLGTANHELISELNRICGKLGLYAYFRDGNLVILNSKGEVTGEYEAESGLIQATQNPWNPKGIGACENVVWMVSGRDKAGVKAAVEILTNRWDELRYVYAIAIVNGEVIKIP